jgi:HTH-type transcriptional regulator / antitoxin HigA
MELHPIRTETDYQEAFQEIELLFNATPNTPEYDRLDVLSTLVEAYEKKHIPIIIPDPIEAIQSQLIDQPNALKGRR